jgi:hypothetical protein
MPLLRKLQLCCVLVGCLTTYSQRALACKGCHCSVPEHFVQICYSSSGQQCEVDLHKAAPTYSGCSLPDFRTLACGTCGPTYQDLYIPPQSDSCYVAKNREQKTSGELVAAKRATNPPNCDSSVPVSKSIKSTIDRVDHELKLDTNTERP